MADNKMQQRIDYSLVGIILLITAVVFGWRRRNSAAWTFMAPTFETSILRKQIWKRYKMLKALTSEGHYWVLDKHRLSG